MDPAVSLSDVGVRFSVARDGVRLANIPRLRPTAKSVVWGLREVTLDVARGEVLGVMGANGSGKTTLLRTVAGILRPDEGSVHITGRVATLLSASAGLKSELTGRQNIQVSATLIGLTRKEALATTDDVVRFAELEEFIDMPARVYSAGMRARLGFAIAMFSDPDIVVIDEVMSAADRPFRDRSEAWLSRMVETGRTVLLASHDPAELARRCNRIVQLRRGRIVEVDDPASVIRD